MCCVVVVFCVPFASTFVVHCLQGFTSYISEQGCGGFLEALSVIFFPIMLTMVGNNPVYINLTTYTSECSHGRHSAPQTQGASRTAEIGRPGQRHA